MENQTVLAIKGGEDYDSMAGKKAKKRKNCIKSIIFCISVVFTILLTGIWYIFSDLQNTIKNVSNNRITNEMITVTGIVLALSTFLYEQYNKANYNSRVFFRGGFTVCTILSGISLLIWILALVDQLKLDEFKVVLAFLGPILTVTFNTSIAISQGVLWTLELVGFSAALRNH